MSYFSYVSLWNCLRGKLCYLCSLKIRILSYKFFMRAGLFPCIIKLRLEQRAYLTQSTFLVYTFMSFCLIFLFSYCLLLFCNNVCRLTCYDKLLAPHVVLFYLLQANAPFVSCRPLLCVCVCVCKLQSAINGRHGI